MKRRHFLKQSTVFFAASCLTGQEMLASAVAKRNKGRIGLQLWSIRPELAQDVKGNLKKVAEIGFSAIETFGHFKENEKFFGLTAKELNGITKDLGMSISGSMYQGEEWLPENVNTPEWDSWKRCIADIHAMDAKWAVQASAPGIYIETMDQLKRIATYFELAGDLCRQNGLKFGFHTHEHNFIVIDGISAIDYLLQQTNPKQVFFQFDMCNVLDAGADPMEYMLNYPGRFPLWHATDYDIEKRQIVEVGKGDMNYPALFDKAKSFGLEQLTVEIHIPGDSFAMCKEAFNYFKQFKWTKGNL